MTNQPKAESFSQKRPILAVILIELLLLLAVTAAGAYATIRQLNYAQPIVLAFIPIALVLVIYLTLRRRWSFYGFQSLTQITRAGWITYLPLVLVLLLISLKGFRSLPMSEFLFYLFFTMLVGFVEETLYRGLILRILLPKGVKVAVATSAILFGITHMLNALSSQNMAQTVLQIVYALIMGLFLALLVVKNSNIWPLITFHFLHNLIQFNSKALDVLVYDILVIVVLAAAFVWLLLDLKKHKLRQGAVQAAN